MGDGYGFLVFIAFALVFATGACVFLQWGIRIGKALQQPAPDAPQAVAAKAVKRTYSLIRRAKGIYPTPVKEEKREHAFFD